MLTTNWPQAHVQFPMTNVQLTKIDFFVQNISEIKVMNTFYEQP